MSKFMQGEAKHESSYVTSLIKKRLRNELRWSKVKYDSENAWIYMTWRDEVYSDDIDQRLTIDLFW
jgi:hypothetical protein